MNDATVLSLRTEPTHGVCYVYWETRAEPGWEEQLYPDGGGDHEAAEGLESQTTE